MVHLNVRYKVCYIKNRESCLTGRVKLGGSEGQEAVVDKRLSQVILQVLQGTLASDNSLHIHQRNINRHCLRLHRSSADKVSKHTWPLN